MRRVISNNLFMLQYVLRCCPSQIGAAVGYAVLTCATAVANILMTKYILDAITGRWNVNGVIICVGGILLLGLLSNILAGYIANYLTPKNTKTLHSKMQQELFVKAAKLSFECYDDPEFFNDFSLAITQADSRAWGVLQSFTGLLSTLLNSVALISILGTISPILIVLSIIGVAISMVSEYFTLTTSHQYNLEMIPPQRVMDYVRRVYYQREFAQEIRYNPQVACILHAKYRSSTEQLFSTIKKYAPKLFLLQTGRDSVSIILKGCSLGFLLNGVFHGLITVGEYAASSSGCARLYSELNSLFNCVFQFYDHSLYAEHFRKFITSQRLQLSFDKQKCIFPPDFQIEFSNVSYSYSAQGSPTLKDISFSISSGDKIAVVGENGSGKSTLIKLLSRLYEPMSGEITLNGINLQKYDVDSFRDNISVATQDYQIFALSIAENILMRPFNNTDEDVQIVKEALSFVGLLEKVESLPDGIMTQLSREFSANGVVFSGGECQRVIVARAYARKCRLLVLDEPTSALDSISSKSFVRMLFGVSRDMTVVLITHDIRSLELADRILVLENGEIVEDGTHTELINNGGKYSEVLCVAN